MFPLCHGELMDFSAECRKVEAADVLIKMKEKKN